MKLRTLAAVLAALSIAGTGTVTAQTENVRVLTVEEAVDLALENNIQLSSADIDLRIKKRSFDTAWKVFIPNIQASGTLARTNMGEMSVATGNPMAPYMTVELSETDRWTAMGNLSIGLNLNLALIEGLRATRQGYEAGRLSWEQARFQTEQNVRKSFYGILLQQGSLSLAREKLTTSEERLKQTLTNYQNGLVPELAYLQTQLAVETQKPSIQEAELNLLQQKHLFGFLLGLPLETAIELSGEINPALFPIDADALLADGLGDRLDLNILSKNIDVMRTQYRATALQVYSPTVALSQTFSPRLSAIDADWSNADNWTDSSGAFSITVAFNLTSLLPFSSNGVALRDLRENISVMENSLRQARYMGELEVRNLVRKLEKSRSAITAMELNVSIAEKAYRLSEQGYRAGTIEFLDLKDSENTMLQAKLGLIAEKFTYISNLIDLENALSVKLNK